MSQVVDAVAEAAQTSGFSGVVRVDQAGRTVVAAAYGLADRAHEIAMTLDSQLATASASKGMTALAVMSLVDDGALDLSTRVRTVLGDDLPLIDDDVTVEHLLSHRSGIGDYLDEDVHTEVDEYVLPVPVHRLATTEQFLAVLDGYPQQFPPGARFAYCNGGYVVLALVAERVSGIGFHDLVQQRVCAPAGLADTAFLRSDELPGRAALGYVHVEGRWRTNVLHLPVRGTGDGGIYTTVSDVHRFWSALFAGRIVPEATVARMVRPRDTTEPGFRYGLGFWLDATSEAVGLEGMDAGVSFRSRHHPSGDLTWTVIANTSEGAWPVARAIQAAL